MEFLTTLMQHASRTGSRSTVLQPLIWFTGLLTIGLVGGGYYLLPFWLLIIFSTFWVITVIIFLAFFVYFAINNPDLLRSERFSANGSIKSTILPVAADTTGKPAINRSRPIAKSEFSIIFPRNSHKTKVAMAPNAPMLTMLVTILHKFPQCQARFPTKRNAYII